MRTSRSRRQQARIHMNHKIRGNARHRGRIAGFNDGFQEGYLRGRADVIMKIPREPIPMRPLHVCYVTTGKGYPYAPMDEGMRNTWQELVSQVSVCGPRDGVAAVAGQQRPDLVFALDGMELPVEQVDAVRELGIRTALWITDDPYYTDVMSSIVTHYDYVFTLEANSVDYYRSIGANVYFLPFGVYPGQFRPLRSPAKVRREISFIGSAYWSRIGMLEPILPELMKRGLVLSGLWWDRMPRYPQYARQIELNRNLRLRYAAAYRRAIGCLQILYSGPRNRDLFFSARDACQDRLLFKSRARAARHCAPRFGPDDARSYVCSPLEPGADHHFRLERYNRRAISSCAIPLLWR